MDRFIILFLLLTLVSCSQGDKNSKPTLTGTEILNKSISVHDPQQAWSQLDFNLHIQEPRTGNPLRYSKVKLDNATQAFELTRNRDEHFSRHVIDAEGTARVYFNEKEETDTSLIKKYRLDPQRNQGYRSFYQMLYGLPMSLKAEQVHAIGDVELAIYNQHECYKIPVELKEALFSKYWIIYISTTSYAFKGMEIIFPEDATKGERLYYEGEIKIKGVTIPRIRHWREYSDNAYSGSDIIVKELE